ncbi:MAG: hypothetical protein B7Z72_13620, partial [Gemmatimonadetes bacterium 21-71-4]
MPALVLSARGLQALYLLAPLAVQAILDSAKPIHIIMPIMRIGKGRVTAAEVARRAGVSQPTVSLILTRNPKARVAPETRQRVLRIAAEIGYRPNRLAQGLVGRRSFAVGI